MLRSKRGPPPPKIDRIESFVELFANMKFVTFEGVLNLCALVKFNHLLVEDPRGTVCFLGLGKLCFLRDQRSISPLEILYSTKCLLNYNFVLFIPEQKVLNLFSHESLFCHGSVKPM